MIKFSYVSSGCFGSGIEYNSMCVCFIRFRGKVKTLNAQKVTFAFPPFAGVLRKERPAGDKGLRK